MRTKVAIALATVYVDRVDVMARAARKYVTEGECGECRVSTCAPTGDRHALRVNQASLGEEATGS